MQDTEEYQDASKAVKSDSTTAERGKRPPRRAAIIARENVNFLHGNIQNGLELRESRKAGEKAQRILDREIETDSETDTDQDEGNGSNDEHGTSDQHGSVAPAASKRSIAEIINDNGEVFDKSASKDLSKAKPVDQVPPTTTATTSDHHPSPVTMRTFGKNQPKLKKTIKIDRPTPKSSAHPDTPPVVSKPIGTIASIHPSYKLPTAKIARKKPTIKPDMSKQKVETAKSDLFGNGGKAGSDTPSTSKPGAISNGSQPPPPPLKKAPPKDDLKSVGQKSDKFEKLPKKEKEKENKPEGLKDGPKTPSPDGLKADPFDHHRVEKIKNLFNNWIVERRQKRTQN